MGYSNWSQDAYRSVREARVRSVPTEIFRDQGSVHPLMDPRQIRSRECRDSEHHPRSTPIVVAFDVTASMGHIPTDFAKVQLGRLMTQVLENGWVIDPQILFAAVGDAVSDRAPLQVGQFESGLEMDAWLTRIWLEGQGGDIPESYSLAHWFAAHRTSTDAWEQRRQRGMLFTIGDAPDKRLRPSHVARVFGGPAPSEEEVAALADAVDERWSCWHVLVPAGDTISDRARQAWRQRLGSRVLECMEPAAICELMGVVMARETGRISASGGRELLVAAGLLEREVDLVDAAFTA